MPDVRKRKKSASQMCGIGGCEKGPSFGFPGGKIVRCGEHRDEYMINLNKRPRCKYPGCTIENSSFGFEGGKRERCYEHRIIGMINLEGEKGRCREEGCRVYATFGFLGRGAERCKQHLLEGMLSVATKNKLCKHMDCKIRANYGFAGEKAIFCAKHRLDEMIDVKNKRCPGPPGLLGCPVNSIIVGNYARRGFCASCDTSEERLRKRKKTEERCFSELEKNYGLVPTCREFRVDYACITASSKKYSFIDGVFDTPGVRVFLEIDEMAHSGYDRGCEERRMQDVAAAIRLSGDERPVFWVRFNPDEPGGAKVGKPSEQRKRCALVAECLNRALKNETNGIEYVNY